MKTAADTYAVSEHELQVDYTENAEERVIAFTLGTQTIEIATPRRGYGMLIVRDSHKGELERYYGLSMAIDHVGEILGVPPHSIPIPEDADDFGIE